MSAAHQRGSFQGRIIRCRPKLTCYNWSVLSFKIRKSNVLRDVPSIYPIRRIMKHLIIALGLSLGLILGLMPKSQAESAEVTLTGTGCCAKCELKQADSCQNALKSGDLVYLLEHNAVSKAFHKNLCSGTKAITAVGSVKDVDGNKVLVATKISLAGDEAKSDAPQQFAGTGVCTKCVSKITAQCQNGIIVDIGGKKILHFIEHNDVSQAYHSEVCQGPKATVVHGKVTEVNGIKKIVATKIEVAPKKEAKAEKKVAAPEKKVAASTVTLKGNGCCLKCELGKSDSCQNALQASVDGKETLIIFAKNEASNGFHKNLCSSTAPIVAVGTLAKDGDQSVLTPSSIKLQEKKTLTGEALCLKCELKISSSCKNAIRVSVDGKERMYILDQNQISRQFHSKVCQSTVSVSAEGSVAVIDGMLEFTATAIEAK